MSQDLVKREAAKQWFEEHGVSVADWAAANGFSPNHVYAVLNGRTRGRRGTAHRIAVALGIKATPADSFNSGPGHAIATPREDSSEPTLSKLP